MASPPIVRPGASDAVNRRAGSPPASGGNRLRRRFFLVTFLAIEFVVVFELLLRFVSPIHSYSTPGDLQDNDAVTMVHRKSPIRGLKFEMSPNLHLLNELPGSEIEIRTNSLGMRDNEPLGRRDAVRIAALGDSFTFGWGVIKSEDVYTELLEAELNRGTAEPLVDVMNFGVMGYAAAEQPLVLEHKALPWNPRLVIWQYFLNDPEIEPIQPGETVYRDTVEWWQHWQVGRYVALQSYQLRSYFYGRGDYFRFLHAPQTPEWNSVLAAFDRAKKLTEDANVPVLMVIFPEPPNDGWAAYRYEDIHRQAAAAARERGFDVIDLLPVFRRHDPRKLRLDASDHHPTPRAHRIAADTLVEPVQSFLSVDLPQNP